MEQPDTNDMRGLAIGISDFKRIRERDDFYVDKTGLIEFILDHDSVCAFLFTRPRRFGKSLNLSMIDAFFNMRYEGDRWFKGLKITENAAYREHLNGYPVVSMNLKDVLVGSIDEFLGSMRRTIRDLYDSHPCLSNSSALTEFQRKSYGSVVRMEDGPILEYAIRDLCDMLCAHHGRPAIVLIDEYDGPINRAEGEVKEKVLQFMRTLLSASLKDSQSLKFGVLTGVLQIAKENIFSGLNNLYVNNVFSEDMGEAFGFTEEEVKGLVDESCQPDMMEAIKEWYDGYRFGDAEVYNPWSILNCISRGYSMEPYWVWEGNPRIILDSVRSIGFSAVERLSEIYNGNEVEVKIRERLTFSELGTIEGLMSAMAASGYLKAVPSGDSYSLSLPNKEVREGLMDQLLACAWGSSYLNEVSEAILSGDPDSLSKRLQESLDRSADVSSLRDELDYGLFALGILDSLKDTHFVRPERGAGKGYADIVVVPRDGRGPSAVLELKRTGKRSSDKTMEEMAEKAVAQIKEKRYFAGLRGEVLLYGVAFRQTDVFVRFERINRRRQPEERTSAGWKDGGTKPPVCSGLDENAFGPFESLS